MSNLAGDLLLHHLLSFVLLLFLMEREGEEESIGRKVCI